MIFTCNEKHYELIFRTEGIWPIRKSIETFLYYRKNYRPDVFQNLGGLASEQGEIWFKMRSKVNPVMLQPKVVNSYIGNVDQVAIDFLDKMKTIQEENGEMPSNFGTELNHWALESIGVIALDQRLGVLTFESNSESQQIVQVLYTSSFWI